MEETDMDDFINNEFLEPEITEDDESSIYLSIGDLMSGLLMFFALLFITALLQLAEREAPKEDVISQIFQEMKNNVLFWCFSFC